MDVLGVISLAITIIGFIVKITSGGESNDTPAQYNYNEPIDHFQEGTLDGIVNCYETFRVSKLNMYHLERNLRSAHHTKFNLLATKLLGNCLYLSVQFVDVFDRKTKSGEIQEIHNDVVTYFSINYLEDSNSVIVYGCSSYNQRVKDSYKIIAGEIRKAISI
ncbi:MULTISPECIES: hypothetical protein [Pedobacter]|uniref:hypothetical protein n=1 Tax=Pedobacter TaxID=84567 RepID=UPI00120C3540|nr:MULTISPECIES: hypothetical protein [Pedobacter]RZL16130.1 MAG: hypothetical protein EOO96_29415 [Pedobacter sp.]